MDSNPVGTVRSTTQGLVQDINTRISSFVSSQYQAATLVFLIPCIWIYYRQLHAKRSPESSNERPGSVSDTIGTDALVTDPGLLRKHSSYTAYTIATGITYPSIRTFYRPHPQGEKLPSEPAPIPLLVFIHGLGGSIAQFNPLLTSLVNCADCLAIDLPGCGLSRFAPKSWSAYTTANLVHLVAIIIEKYRKENQRVVLVCHSMGCSLGAMLSSSSSPLSSLLSRHVLGLIAICPVAEPPDEERVASIRKLQWIPGTILDLWRLYDRWGGTESASVARFVGAGAEEETKRLQLRFNEQSRTPVWRRMVLGTMPTYENGKPEGGLPGRDVWAGIRTSIFLIAGDADPITPAHNVRKIAEFLGQANKVATNSAPTSSNDTNTAADGKSNLDASSHEKTRIDSADHIYKASEKSTLKTLILPAPASHALMYAPRTSRPLSGHIQTFLSSHIDARLSLGWQLQHLCTEGKWDVKNFRKWEGVTPVSPPINNLFRAMKTLREVDVSHSPRTFVKEWSLANSPGGKDGKGAIAVVVDISHESPVYDPRGLEEGGIAYRKFPTVSKFPPTVDEVTQFIALVDGLRDDFPIGVGALVAVHCHYGFNRTGFFIVAYLIERCGFSLKKALREFRERRAPGIRHQHFVDELWARYGIDVVG